jgi:hypothetical protein
MDSADSFFPFRIGGGWYHVPPAMKSRPLRRSHKLWGFA